MSLTYATRRALLSTTASSGPAPPLNAQFTKVNGPTDGPTSGPYNGWSVTFPGTPVLSDFDVQRVGFDSTGTANSFIERFSIPTRVRDVYPNAGTNPSAPNWTATTAASSDYIYSTDSVYGATNNSTITSPKPIARWNLPGRRMVGNSLELELVAAHYNARNQEQVACVEFTVSDGTTTLTTLVSQSSISPYAYDKAPSIVYRAVIDVSSLINPSTLTVNARVFPFVGDISSIRRSVDGAVANPWEFSTLTFRRDTTKFNSPPYAYIISGGVDATVDVNGQAAGITKISTNATTAAANGFASLQSALAALKAATNVTGGFTDGCIIRISNVTFLSNTSTAAGTYQSVAEVQIEGDPLFAATANVLQFGSVSTDLRQDWLRIGKNMTITRLGTQGIRLNNTVGGNLTVEGAIYDNGGFNAAINGSASGSSGVAFMGNACSNMAGNVIGVATANRCYMIRANTGVGLALEGFHVVGNDLENPTVRQNATRGLDNSFVGFNKMMKCNSGNIGINVGTTNNVNGFALIQNVFEWMGPTASAMLGISADSDTGSMTHVVMHNNTLAGYASAGRGNLLYDENPTIPRFHSLVSIKGYNAPRMTTKGDIFMSDGTRIGNFALAHGVGCADNLIQFKSADSENQQTFTGIGSIPGSIDFTPVMPISAYVNYAAVTAVSPGIYTAGAGGGDYRVNAGATVEAMQDKAVLRFNLTGLTRSATFTNTGAY